MLRLDSWKLKNAVEMNFMVLFTFSSVIVRIRSLSSLKRFESLSLTDVEPFQHFGVLSEQ